MDIFFIIRMIFLSPSSKDFGHDERGGDSIEGSNFVLQILKDPIIVHYIAPNRCE